MINGKGKALHMNT